MNRAYVNVSAHDFMRSYSRVKLGYRINDTWGTFQESDGMWIVTHLATGYRIGSTKTRRDAALVANNMPNGFKTVTLDRSERLFKVVFTAEFSKDQLRASRDEWSDRGILKV